MNTKKIILTFVCLLTLFPVWAQKQISITGTVTDSTGEPMPGVSVFVENSRIGTTTDLDGKYKLTVNENMNLSFSFIGYETLVRKVTDKTVYNVTLHEDSILLEGAVVNVGYGSMRKSDLTGSVSSVVMSDIENQSKASVESLLQGRMSGVQVVSGDGTPGGGLSVKIRGAASVTASTEPLYVIDGFPYVTENTNQSSVMSGASPDMSPLAMLNPNDIESIEVLKDASATAIYGSRAANGVVLITTRMGAEGKARVSYNGNFGVQQITRTMEMLSQQEYLDLIREEGNGFNPTAPFFDENGFIKEELEDPKAFIDWQDLIFRLGHKTEHQISIAGGTKEAKYNVSFGIYDENGIVINSDFTRYSGRANLDLKINKWLSFGTRNSLNYIENSGPWSGGSINQFAGVTFKALKYRPINFNPYAENFDPGEMIDENMNNTSNPLVFANDITKKKTSLGVMSNAYFDVKFHKNLHLKVTAGINFNNTRNNNYFPRHTDIGRLVNGRGEAGNVASTNFTHEDILTYNLRKKKHSLNIMGAFSLQCYRLNSQYMDVRDFQSETNGAWDMSMGTQVFAKSTNFKMFNTVSFLGRINYNYDSRYYITASYRRDGSSRFGANHKWADFPSVALAWRVSQEKFMAKAKPYLSSMKLRVSYGWTGNQNINPYSSLAILGPVDTSWGDSPAIGYRPNSWGNDDLKWETTKQFDAGIDLEFFKGRFGISYDYYHKNTVDMLLSMKVPTVSGYGNRLANIGSIQQWGHELTINATPIQRAFKWELGLNMSFEGNKVGSLGEGVTEMNAGLHHKVVPGMPLGTFYGWQYDGLYQKEDFDEHGKLKPEVPTVTGFTSKHQPGDMKFKDISGPEGTPDGLINEYDKTVIGYASPKFYGGFTNNFRYKNFELKVFMNFSYGNSIYNKNMENFGVPVINEAQNYFARVADHWTPENTDTDVPRLCPGNKGKHTNKNQSVDYFLEDGSFLRLANITLGYNLPKKALSKIHMSGIKIYFSVDNVYTFTKYSGYDPEVSMNSNPLTPGMDSNPYPRARVYKLGLNLNF